LNPTTNLLRRKKENERQNNYSYYFDCNFVPIVFSNNNDASSNTTSRSTDTRFYKYGEKLMARPKKKIQKREKVFNFISKVIDLIKYKWRTVIKTAIVVAILSLFIYVVFFWIDTVAEIKFEIIYL